MASVIAILAEEGVLLIEPPVEIEARAKRFREVIEGESRAKLWVLEHERRLVGDGGVLETSADGVLSVAIAILPDARGIGGGRALLEVIVAYAFSCGAHKLELEVWPDNTRAIGLYESAGFEAEGLRRNHYRRRDGTLRSALVMARAL